MIENSKIRLKADNHHLLSSRDGGNWFYVSTHLLLNLTGYRLARKKVKKEIKCWANVYKWGVSKPHFNKQEAINSAQESKSSIATAVEMTGEYEVWEDE